MARFFVDTHLFRELGTHLVGRDSTALVELVKNAFDADATEVTVDGSGLDQPGGRISITDNGNGMTPEVFTSGFLTIASRSKDTDERRSPRLRRRFTGAKGIGRLAAHKLSSVVAVTSTPRPDVFKTGRLHGVDAIIDWDEIERHPTLDDVGDGLQVTKTTVSRSSEGPFGTRLELSPLREPFEAAELQRFITEVTTFEAPAVLTDALPDTVVTEPVLFDAVPLRDVTKNDSFDLRFTGDLANIEDLWQLVAERTHWVLEINAAARARQVQYVIAPTLTGVRRNKFSQRREFSGLHPSPGRGPAFGARILVSETGRFGRDSASDFARKNSGIRVYMEGFRVLPYGDTEDDWLRLDSDYTRRREAFDLTGISGDLESVENESFFKLSNKNFFGGVFLQEETAGGLEMLINREGFLPNRDLEALRTMVRQGVDLVARVRAAAEERKKADQNADKKPTKKRSGDKAPSSAAPVVPMSSLRQLEVSLEAVRAAAARAGTGATIDDDLATAEVALGDIRNDQATFRTLATLGTQFSAFVHETNLLLGQARFLQNLVGEDETSTRAVAEAADELVETLERQASFLADLIGSQTRRSRDPLDPLERLDAALRLLGPQIDKRGITLKTDVPDGLRTPAMFRSELTAILTNLLSNAIKAAGQDGRILLSASKRPGRGGTVLRVENSGDGVDLADGEKWFVPFESSTPVVDEALGVGLGLGLPIVRRLIEDYGGDVTFVKPTRGYATAVEIRIPHSKRTKE